MTNFDFLQRDPQFKSFADVAVSAEKILHMDIGAAVLNCRRAMEFAVKWMYSVDDVLVMPYQDKLVSLIGTEEFHGLVPPDIIRRLHYIRKIGNDAAHGSRKISRGEAELCLENLFWFMDFIACCYGAEYEEKAFDPSLLDKHSEPVEKIAGSELDFKALIAENESLKAELTARRAEQQLQYNPKPLDISEYKTRKLYIDAMLRDAGWIEGKNWINEVELPGMPNKSEVGYADYVLYDDAHKPLAVIEAKRTCVDVSAGRQQAKLYADLLEKQYRRRPLIFLSNGFDTRLVDEPYYPERKVADFYSKRDIEKLFNLRRLRAPLKNITVNGEIAGRYYQKAAIKAVCDAFDEKNRRKALLVMATGSGKTRTVIGLVDVLLKHGWVKNVLFLADRNSLVTQAKRSFVNMLPDLSVTNLCEEKDNYSAHCVFSTYQTMIHCIDDVRDEEGRLFTCGHFDLLICDEAHRSIYNKYRDIFTYFDAPLVGLTATPKDEIDKNTYEIFELENGVPTYGYELAQAVKDEFLVDYVSVESKLKFLEEGIYYDELSADEKAHYEKTFVDENGELPEHIGSSALNSWLFNEDTIKEVLHLLMTEGLRVDYGEKLGKTIIFAKNHNHAEAIFKVFNKEYPHLSGYAKVIDNYMKYAQSAIDEFSEPDKGPRIAISVDMLDTGIDVPSVLNLVFFKKVMSKAKFWQMIGRGTRRCDGLIDGENKNIFYIFDFCGNFEFFRQNVRGRETSNRLPLQGAIFHLKSQIAFKLQEMEYQQEELMAFRERMVLDMVAKVQELNRDHFAVRQHLRYVDTFAQAENYQALTYADTVDIRNEVAPLIHPDKDLPGAVRFDALMYGIELAYLAGRKGYKGLSDLKKKVTALSRIVTIPAVAEQMELYEQILHTDYLEQAGINEFEHIRESLRDLIKYIPIEIQTYESNYDDEILGIEWRPSELENDDLKNYREKAEYYVREHQDEAVIAKLKSNVPLDEDDIAQLEEILWSEVGTREDYAAEFGEKPLGEFVREIVGLSMTAAKAAFAEYLDSASFDSNQIYFVNQIVEYIVHNGMMKDLSVLQEPPFTDHGNIVELFQDVNVWMGIRNVIQQINANACVA